MGQKILQKLRRVGLFGLLGKESVQRLDDAEALAAMRGAHWVYRRMKQTEADKGAAEAAIKAAADDW